MNYFDRFSCFCHFCFVMIILFPFLNCELLLNLKISKNFPVLFSFGVEMGLGY